MTASPPVNLGVKQHKSTMFHHLRNLGPASSAMLVKAGIHGVAQLRAMGSVAAYVAVKNAGAGPSLNLLWAIEGALTDRDWKEVSKTDRLSLLVQLDDYERNRT
jgi:DNA transformation protein